MGLFGKKKDKAESKITLMDKVNKVAFDVQTTGVKGIIDNKIQQTIGNLIAEGRLVFHGDDSLEYTTKEGYKHDWTFSDMAALLAERSHLLYMEKVGINVDTIKAMLTETYQGAKTIEGEVVDGEIKKIGDRDATG